MDYSNRNIYPYLHGDKARQRHDRMGQVVPGIACIFCAGQAGVRDVSDSFTYHLLVHGFHDTLHGDNSFLIHYYLLGYDYRYGHRFCGALFAGESACWLLSYHLLLGFQIPVVAGVVLMSIHCVLFNSHVWNAGGKALR